MISGTYSEIEFGGRKVKVTIWFGRGLGVVDPERQAGVSRTQVRTWIAYENKEVVLYFSYPIPSQPVSLSQTGLALRGYAAFLDPELERPQSLDTLPDRYSHPLGHEPEVPYRQPTDRDDISLGDWVDSNQAPNLYDDDNGDLDPARPVAPTANYTGTPGEVDDDE